MTDLYLIRHAEDMSQAQDFLKDYGLTQRGILQAEHLRNRLASTGEIAANVLISSTFPRALQTAEIIAPALNLSVTLDNEIQGLRIGEAEGLHVDELKKQYGTSYKLDEPFRPISPSGESWGQFVLRIGGALDRIIHQYDGKSIVIVCHGGIIDCSFFYFFGMSTLSIPSVRFTIYYTSITHWSKKAYSDRPLRWRLVRFNDDMHVCDIDRPIRIPWEYMQKPNSTGLGIWDRKKEQPS